MSTFVRQTKPRKPYSSFPLTAHNNGQWCKKIRGKIHFFGVWADPQAALDHYLVAAADLHAGRQPLQARLSPESALVKDVCNNYLTHQLRKVENQEIRPSTFEDCRSTALSFASCVGSARAVASLGPGDFEEYRNTIAHNGLGRRRRRLGVHALNRAITIIRGMFKYAYGNDMIDKPVKFGTGFDRPSASLKRRARHSADLENGKRLYEPREIVLMLQEAYVPLQAMILLGINGGMGNTDCARLPLRAVDLDGATIEFDRPKSGVERVVPLWPETVAALRRAIEKRPRPADGNADKLVFLTVHGRPWVRENVHRKQGTGISKVVPVDAVGEQFDKLLTALNLKRKGLGFYALRHTFRTWADEIRDQHAIHRIMGHSIPGMSGVYIEKIELHRLRAVVDHVRRKLYGESSPSSPPA